MKMNIKLLTQSKELSRQITNYVDKEDYDKTRLFLQRYFPSSILIFLHDNLIIEIADILVSCIEEKDYDLDSYLKELKESINKLITQYNKDKEKARIQLRAAKNEYNMENVTKETLETINYDEETVTSILGLLDAREHYYSYADGYDNERYKAYNWLIRYIDEALSDITHDSVNPNANVLD